MKISYNGFWHNFDAKYNWLNFMFMEYFNDYTIEFSDNHNGSDIIVSSVFNPQHISDPKPIQIFFTGESRKDGYSSNQILLGFDKTDKVNKVFRLPLWYLYINWWSDIYVPKQILGAPTYTIDINKLMKASTEEEIDLFINRPRFCSIVASNGVYNRIEVANALDQIAPVDKFGNAFSNRYDGEKKDLLLNSKFNICFENIISSGYVTEKLFEAKLLGCIPIYWGDKMAKSDFNPECFIDYTSMNLKELAIKIDKLYNSDEIKELAAQPMFLKKPSLDGLYEFFDEMRIK